MLDFIISEEVKEKCPKAVLADENGAFGSPTSDSERAMITENAKRIVMCIYSFSGRENLEKYLNEAEELLKRYAQGSSFERKIVE